MKNLKQISVLLFAFCICIINASAVDDESKNKSVTCKYYAPYEQKTDKATLVVSPNQLGFYDGKGTLEVIGGMPVDSTKAVFEISNLSVKNGTNCPKYLFVQYDDFYTTGMLDHKIEYTVEVAESSDDHKCPQNKEDHTYICNTLKLEENNINYTDSDDEVASQCLLKDESGRISFYFRTDKQGSKEFCVNSVTNCSNDFSGSTAPIVSYNGNKYKVAADNISILWGSNCNSETMLLKSSLENDIYILRGERKVNEENNPITVPVKKLDITPVTFCGNNGVLKAFQIVGYIIFVIKLVVPLILIILAMIDFAKAVIDSTDKPSYDTIKTLVRRCIIAAVIFLIPTILNFLLSLVDGVTEIMSSDGGFIDCTDCLLDPLGDCKAEDFNG